jgi:hypothetical protein
MLDRLDRLDRAEYARGLVEPTELACEIYAPLTEQAPPLYERFTGEQLATILDFLRIANNEFCVAQIAPVEALGREEHRGCDRIDDVVRGS